jgi:hypothetical protein
VADVTIKAARVFPDGTEVGAYRRRPSRTSVPIGHPEATATVEGGEVSFSDLVKGQRYWVLTPEGGQNLGFIAGEDEAYAPRIDSTRFAAARAAERAYLESRFSEGFTQLWDAALAAPNSRPALEATEMPAGAEAVPLWGYDAPGDRGGTLYKRVGSEPLHAGKVLDANGIWWELVEDTHLDLAYFGVREGRADNGPYYQDALDYWADKLADSRNHAAGVLKQPRGRIISAEPLVISAPIGIQGAGVVVQNFPNTDEFSADANVLVGDHDGDVLRLQSPSAWVDNFGVDSSEDRISEGGAGMGIRVEPPDTTSGRAHGCQISRVKVANQPSHGIALIGMTPRSKVIEFGSTKNGGHGLVVDRGQLSGRTNKPQGNQQILLAYGQSRLNGGHGLAVGHPDETGGPAFRIEGINLDIGLNASDEAVRYQPYQVYANGNGIVFDLCGFGSEGDASPTGSLYAAGRSIHARNCRWIDASSPAIMLASPSWTTNRGFALDGGIVVAATAFDPFLDWADSTVRGVYARMAEQSASLITNFVTPGKTLPPDSDIMYAGKRHTRLQAAGFRSGDAIPVNDDTAASIEFDGDAKGVAVISGSTGGLRGTTVHFRVGATNHATLISSSANVVATTGELTGTTGTDGNLTISAHTDRKLYIENRRGQNGTYTVTFLSLVDGNPV